MRPSSSNGPKPLIPRLVASFRAVSGDRGDARRRRTYPACEPLEGRWFLNGAWSGPAPIAVNPQPLPPLPTPVAVAGVDPSPRHPAATCILIGL
jgi:hypothetical protein